MTIFFRNDACFCCPCLVCRKDPEAQGITEVLEQRLNAIQAHINFETPEEETDLVVTSGRRCVAHNAAVGGAPKSQHLKGLAVDIATRDAELAYRLVDAAMVLSIPSIEVCPTHVHLDLRPLDKPRLWVGGDG